MDRQLAVTLPNSSRVPRSHANPSSSPQSCDNRIVPSNDAKDTMGLLTFSTNVTLDGCVDHQEGIADDETHAFFTRLMEEGGAMMWGRVTCEILGSRWADVARGGPD